MSMTFPKHELKPRTSSKAGVGTDIQVVESAEIKILRSDDSPSSTTVTVAPHDKEMVDATDDAAASPTATLSKSSLEHKKADTDSFMAAYDAIFGGDDADVPVGSETSLPAHKSTTPLSSVGQTWSFPSLSKSSSSLPFMDSGEGAILDATLMGTSLDFGVSCCASMPEAVVSMDNKVLMISNKKSTRVNPLPVRIPTVLDGDESDAPYDATGKKDPMTPEVVPVPTKPRIVDKCQTSKATTARTKTTRSSRPKKKKGPKGDYLDSEPTKLDVLLGRGGLTNHWAGNKHYLDEVHKLQEWYKVSSKNEKTDLSQALVNHIQTYGGRFIARDEETKQWYVVSNLVARRKVSQALREHKTAEERKMLKAASKMAT